MVVVLITSMNLGGKYFFCMIDHNQLRLEGFKLEKKNSLDVVLMGSSEVYYGYLANEAYRSSGITSYPYAFQINPATLWKYELREILKYQTPKVLVVEVNGAGYGKRYANDKIYDEGSIRFLSDSMSFGKDKIEMLKDMAAHRKDSALYYYWKFFKFHSQPIYNGINKDMYSLYKRDYSLLKGISLKAKNARMGKERPIPRNVKPIPVNKIEKAALKEFIAECKRSGIKNVLFVRFPHRIIKDGHLYRYRRFLKIGKIIRASGAEYVDFSNAGAEIGISKKQDFSSPEHLNLHGAAKFTRFFISYLKAKYGLKKTALDAEQKRRWRESVKYLDAFYKLYDDCVNGANKTKLAKKRLLESEEVIAALKQIIEDNEKTTD